MFKRKEKEQPLPYSHAVYNDVVRNLSDSDLEITSAVANRLYLAGPGTVIDPQVRRALEEEINRRAAIDERIDLKLKELKRQAKK
jgi:hypothetical protein